GFFPMYAAHNAQFLAYTLTIQGRGNEAIEKARYARKLTPIEMIKMMPGMDIFLTQTEALMVQFGRWDDLLKEPDPEPFPYATAIHHWARGMALASKGQLDPAKVEADSISAIADRLPADAPEGFNLAKSLLAVASDLLAGRMAEKRGDVAAAI